jgi:hypothetical protein
MRTKQVEGVLRAGVVTLEPRPALYVTYDGLGGLSQRPILRDLIEELARKGPETFQPFLKSLRAHRSGHVHVYFSDYVSYGIGGGDATSEFFFGTFLLLHEGAKSSGPSSPTPEQLVLVRNSGNEFLPLEAASS